MKLLSSYSKTDKQILYIVSLIWGVDLLYYLKAVLLRLPILQHLSDFFIPTVIVLSLLMCSRSIMTRITLKDYMFYFCGVMLYLLQFLLFPQNYDYLYDSFSSIFLKVVPFFYIGLLFDERKQLNILTYVSITYIILGAAYFFLIGSKVMGYSAEEEDMGKAYAYLPHILIVTYSLFKRFNIYKLVVVIIGLIYVLGTGNRGSLSFIFLFVIMLLLFCTSYKHKIAILLFLICISIIAIYNFDSIIDFLYTLIEGLGMNTRVIQFLMDNDITNDNGRNELIQFFVGKIRESSILGYGIMGDRVLLINSENFYPHNIVIEFIVQYGILLGPFLLLIISVVSIKAWIHSTSVDMKAFFILLLICGVLSLFLSNSYLMNPLFFMYLGLCINYSRRNENLSVRQF